jgi:hypothetical protein
MITASNETPNTPLLAKLAGIAWITLFLWAFFGFPAIALWELARRKDWAVSKRGLWSGAIAIGWIVWLSGLIVHRLSPALSLLSLATPLSASAYALRYSDRPLLRRSAYLALFTVGLTLFALVYLRRYSAPRL